MEQKYVPTRDANLWAQLDERVANALKSENAYWQSTWARLQEIKMRCHYAGYETNMKL